jgi:hypothetical protein
LNREKTTHIKCRKHRGRVEGRGEGRVGEEEEGRVGVKLW